MSLHTDITSNLDQTRRNLASAEQRVENRLRGINNRALRELQRIARSVVHVRSGRLQRGLVIQGPYNVGSGTLEASVSAPTVPYAGEEASRGGEHDFVTRTLEVGQGVIDQAAQDMERAIVEEIEK
jgi:hypothetical protein